MSDINLLAGLIGVTIDRKESGEATGRVHAVGKSRYVAWESASELLGIQLSVWHPGTGQQVLMTLTKVSSDGSWSAVDHQSFLEDQQYDASAR